MFYYLLISFLQVNNAIAEYAKLTKNMRNTKFINVSLIECEVRSISMKAYIAYSNTKDNKAQPVGEQGIKKISRRMNHSFFILAGDMAYYI